MTSREARALSVLRFVTLRRSSTDLKRSVAFYCGGLGFEVAGNEGAPGEVVLALGAERIALVECSSGMATVAGPDVRFQHAAIVVSDMRAAFERLQRQAPVAISRGGPQRLPAAAGGVRAFKFRDPDGHPLELIEFPPGQGAERWRAAAREGLTLGIDHAAISVSNVDRSIAFYERIGFRLESRQTNRGDEQARLDGLASAKVEVEVVALVPLDAGGPHLELLGYVTPKPERSDGEAPAATDCVVWQAQAIDGRHQVVTDPDGHRNSMIE